MPNNAPTILDQYRYNEPYTNQQNVQQPLTLHQQIALKAIEKNVLEAMLLEEQYKRNPFQLQFHRDMETSTDTLFTGLETKDRSVDNICNESDGHKKVELGGDPQNINNMVEQIENVSSKLYSEVSGFCITTVSNWL